MSKQINYLAKVRKSGDAIKIPKEAIKSLNIKPATYLQVTIEIIDQTAN